MNSQIMKYTKLFLIAISLIASSLTTLGQGTPIPQDTYTILDFSTNNNINVVGRAFDDDDVTFWAIGANSQIPAFVELDLGTDYDVNGFSFLPRPDASNRPGGYEVYLSSDGEEWGIPEITGNMPWIDDTDAERKDIFFGAITARYVRVVYTYSLAANNNIHTADLFIFQSDVPATGQINQAIALSIPNKSTADEPFAVNGTATSGLPLTYSVVSGPATVTGNTVTLTGQAGTVVLEANQAGDDTYYPSVITDAFEVIDLTLFDPVISTRLTENYPLEMNALKAYPIYINADIDQPDFLSIASVTLNIGGETITASENDGYYYYLWTPEDYGVHTIQMTANGSNGNSTTLTRNITVNNGVATQNVQTISDIDIIFGGANSRTYIGSYSMPQHIGVYNNINANLTVACPDIPNACDDWDRLAYIEVMGPDGNWVQIIRYITPYGVPCNHNIDLTDYASLLQGEFEFRIFIDTWGTGGWNLTLDFDFQTGTPAFDYSTVDEVWDARYALGNPSDLQPVGDVSYSFAPNVQEAKLILSNTGHGWGENNTSNAAEFYNATNFIYVNGTNTFTQNLWNDCNPNPDNCTGQLGTWQFDRAGWCPGAIAPPHEWDLTPYIGSDLELGYEFDPTYTDFCHPNNPDCTAGAGCVDCNDTFNPSYEVDGHVVSYSNTPLLFNSHTNNIEDRTLNYVFSAYPNPAQDNLRIYLENSTGPVKVLVYTIQGTGVKTYYFDTSSQVNNYQFDVSNLSNGTYFISIENHQGTGVKKLVINR